MELLQNGKIDLLELALSIRDKKAELYELRFAPRKMRRALKREVNHLITAYNDAVGSKAIELE